MRGVWPRRAALGQDYEAVNEDFHLPPPPSPGELGPMQLTMRLCSSTLTEYWSDNLWYSLEVSTASSQVSLSTLASSQSTLTLKPERGDLFIFDFLF